MGCDGGVWCGVVGCDCVMWCGVMNDWNGGVVLV